MGKGWYRSMLLWSALLGLLFASGGSSGWALTSPFYGLQAASDAELESLRGGYTSMGGVEVTFGIESAVFIDGILQAVTSFNSIAPNVNQPAPFVLVDNVELSAAVGQELVKNQLAAGSLDIEMVRSQLTMVVQNSQDNRIIDNITQLNATVTSLEAFRQIRFFDSLQQQMIDARP